MSEAYQQGTQQLLAAAQTIDRRPSQSGTAGVDDSLVFERDVSDTLGVKCCPLPETYASSCWGMPYNAVTFHANCVPAPDAVTQTSHSASIDEHVNMRFKVKIMHEALDQHSLHHGEAGGGSAGFVCWRNGVRCVEDSGVSKTLSAAEFGSRLGAAWKGIRATDTIATRWSSAAIAFSQSVEASSLGATATASGTISERLAAVVNRLTSAKDPPAHLNLWLLCLEPSGSGLGRCDWRDALVSRMASSGLLPPDAHDVLMNPSAMDDAAVNDHVVGAISPAALALTHWIDATESKTMMGAKGVVNLAILDVPSVSRLHDYSCNAFDWTRVEGRRADASLRGIESVTRALHAKGNAAMIAVGGAGDAEDFELQLSALVAHRDGGTVVSLTHAKRWEVQGETDAYALAKLVTHRILLAHSMFPTDAAATGSDNSAVMCGLDGERDACPSSTVTISVHDLFANSSLLVCGDAMTQDEESVKNGSSKPRLLSPTEDIWRSATKRMSAAADAAVKDGLSSFEALLREGGSVFQEGWGSPPKELERNPMDDDEVLKTTSAFSWHAHDHRHAGHARTRLLWKLASGASIRVGVFGGSVPMGHACPRGARDGPSNAADEGWTPFVNSANQSPGVFHGTPEDLMQYWERGTPPKKDTTQNCAYSARFARWLGTAFPNANHTVINFARGGTNSMATLPYFEGFLDKLQRRAEEAGDLSTPIDLAIVDFAINDGSQLTRHNPRFMDDHAGLDLNQPDHVAFLQRKLEHQEGVFRVLHKRSKGRVAIVMASFWQPSPYYIGLLRPLLSRYNVSLLSDDRALRVVSDATRHKYANIIADWSQHPSWRGHQIVSRLLADNLMRRWKTWMSLASKDEGTFDVDVPAPLPVFCEADRCPGEERYTSRTLLGADRERDTFTGLSRYTFTRGWVWESDSPETHKDIGTIAYNTSVAPLELDFLYSSGGRLSMEMLRSYNNVGDMIAWVPGVNTSINVTSCADVDVLAKIDAKDVLALWRGTTWWEQRVSFASPIVLFPRLPVVEGRVVAKATLFICPLLSPQTKSSKLKLYELRVVVNS